MFQGTPERSGVDEPRRAQLECFVNLSRRRHRAVLTTWDDAVLLSRRARDLHPVDQAAILRLVAEVHDAAHGTVRDLELSGSSSVSVRIHSESPHVRFPSVVLEVIPGSLTQHGLIGLVGTSPSWKALCEAVQCAGRTDAPVLLYSEAGTGKLAVARALHAESGRGSLTVLDVASVVVEGEQQWLRRLRDGLSGDGTLVLAHLDLCDRALAAAVAAEISVASSRCRLVGTVTMPKPQAAEIASLLGRFSVRLHVPPLRDRIEDIDALVLCFVQRHAGGRPVRFLPGALRTLRSVEFADNVRDLERVVASLVATRRGDILASDLPTLDRSATAHLTAMELAERDAIVKVLQEVKGNKAAAAIRLGISRPTLYRKLTNYRINLAD